MRRAVLAGAVSLGLAWSGLQTGVAAAQAFQGMIRFTVHDEGGHTTEITQLLQAREDRASWPRRRARPGGGMIVDSTAGTMTIVNAEEKTYTVINLAMMQQMMQGMAGMARGIGMTHRGSDSTAETEAQGDDHSHRTHRGRRGRDLPGLCLRRDGPGQARDGRGLSRQGRGADGRREHHGRCPASGGCGSNASRCSNGCRRGDRSGTMIAQGYGLLKATNYEDGKLKGTLEVTALQRGAAPESAFQPPAGFTEKSMGDMMGGRRP